MATGIRDTEARGGTNAHPDASAVADAQHQTPDGMTGGRFRRCTGQAERPADEDE